MTSKLTYKLHMDDEEIRSLIASGFRNRFGIAVYGSDIVLRSVGITVPEICATVNGEKKDE